MIKRIFTHHTRLPRGRKDGEDLQIVEDPASPVEQPLEEYFELTRVISHFTCVRIVIPNCSIERIRQRIIVKLRAKFILPSIDESILLIWKPKPLH